MPNSTIAFTDLGSMGLNRMARLVAKATIAAGEEASSYPMPLPPEFSNIALLTSTVAVNGTVYTLAYGVDSGTPKIFVKGGTDDKLPAGEYTLIFVGVHNILNTGAYPQHEHM